MVGSDPAQSTDPASVGVSSGETRHELLSGGARHLSGVALQIVDALSSGIGRLATRDGLILVGLFYVLNAVSGVANALVLPSPAGPGMGPGSPGSGPGAGAPPAPETLLPSLGAALGLSLVVTLVSVVLTIGALRAFVTDATLSTELFVRNLPLAFLNYLVGGVVYAVVVLLGLVLLVVPGIFAMVVLAFWTVLVAVEDENFVAAFGDSWRLTDGSRLRLFALGLVAVVVAVLVSLPFGLVGAIVGFLTGGGTVAQVVSALVGPIGSAITTVFTLGTLAAAYRQLTTDGGANAGTASGSGAVV
jgi:hypothetical protein